MRERSSPRLSSRLVPGIVSLLWSMATSAEGSARRPAPTVVLADDHVPTRLLDVHLPGGGIAAAEAITAHAPETTVVMLTVAPVADELIAAVEAGALGYLSKTMDIRRLPSVLDAALSGEPAVPRALVAWLVDEIRERSRRRAVPFSLGRRVVDLTPREAQVLDLLWKELPTREIAARLGISEVTARRHASTVLRKLGARDRETIAALLNRQRRPGGAS
jgi:DNA-binding NarL/FixJ family response regulator